MYLSDELKKRLEKSRPYEKLYPFPKCEVNGKMMSMPEIVREIGATDKELSNLFNAICEDMTKINNLGYDFFGTAFFWAGFQWTLISIEEKIEAADSHGPDGPQNDNEKDAGDQ